MEDYIPLSGLVWKEIDKVPIFADIPWWSLSDLTYHHISLCCWIYKEPEVFFQTSFRFPLAILEIWENNTEKFMTYKNHFNNWNYMMSLTTGVWIVYFYEKYLQQRSLAFTITGIVSKA